MIGPSRGSSEAARSTAAPVGARLGALLWILGAVQFLVAMVVVQLAWTTPYNAAQNAVSDLGAVACRENPMGTSYVCSPLHAVFNLSIIAFGVVVALGAVAVRPSFPANRRAATGLFALVVAGAGAAVVGVFPEDTIGWAHAVGATLAFAGAALALVLLGLSMTGLPDWARYRGLSLVCGCVSGGTLVASAVRDSWGPLGFGGLERLIVAPALVWLVVLGVGGSRRRGFPARG